MKIVICGSVAFAKDIVSIKKILGQKEHDITVPEDIEKYVQNPNQVENKWKKNESDVIRKYFGKIKKSDAVLIVNKDKNNIKNYLGGNSLIEMAFAYVLNKKIFLLNPIQDINYKDEIKTMKPIIINGDLKKIEAQ